MRQDMRTETSPRGTAKKQVSLVTRLRADGPGQYHQQAAVSSHLIVVTVVITDDRSCHVGNLEISVVQKKKKEKKKKSGCGGGGGGGTKNSLLPPKT